MRFDDWIQTEAGMLALSVGNRGGTVGAMKAAWDASRQDHYPPELNGDDSPVFLGILAGRPQLFVPDPNPPLSPPAVSCQG